MFRSLEESFFSFLQAIHRIHKAAELNRVCTGDLIVKHSTSAVDVTSCFYQIKEFWRQLAWPDLVGSYNFVLKIIDVSNILQLVRSLHYQYNFMK